MDFALALGVLALLTSLPVPFTQHHSFLPILDKALHHAVTHYPPICDHDTTLCLISFYPLEPFVKCLAQTNPRSLLSGLAEANVQ